MYFEVYNTYANNIYDKNSRKIGRAENEGYC